jgi:murein L,D-transpeptidase YcbB/YkuD
MKRISVGACLAFACLCVSAATARTQKATPHKALQTHARRLPLVVHRLNTRESLERAHAKLRTASFSPAIRTQSDSSSTATRALSKKKSGKQKRAAKHEPSQMSPTPERISEIQSALARGGYYRTDATGKWDSDTVDALQRFQSGNGLDTTGKLDALTLQKLGLGSDVAGVSAPKGIVSHSCCSMSPSPSYAPPAAATPTAAISSTTAATPAYSGTPGSGAPATPSSAPR